MTLPTWWPWVCQSSLVADRAGLGRASLLATIPAAWLLGALSMAQLYAVGFGVGTLTTLFDVAVLAYVPSLVGPAMRSCAACRSPAPPTPSSSVQATLFVSAAGALAGVLWFMTGPMRELR